MLKLESNKANGVVTIEKYWKSGEDDEDYYEQDDDCRGADYYWEQHEDCDY